MINNKNSVCGEDVVTTTTANGMKNLVEPFNEMMKEQVKKRFNDAVSYLVEQIKCDGQENKSVSLYSTTFDYQSDYLDEWRKFAWEQGEVEPSVAIEFYRSNVDMFINYDAMDDYVEGLADESGVDDVAFFIQGGCRIYMENPFYDEGVSKTSIVATESGEDVVTNTTAEEMKADFLNRVEKMYDFVKDMGDELKIKRFFSTLDEMKQIAREIDEKGLLGDEQMFDVWELIMTFDDSVQNDMAICNAREYIETRLSSIIKTLQGKKVLIRG